MQNKRFPTTPPTTDAQEQLNFQIEALLPDALHYTDVLYTLTSTPTPSWVDANKRVILGTAPYQPDIELFCAPDQIALWCNNDCTIIDWEDLANALTPEISKISNPLGTPEISEEPIVETRTLPANYGIDEISENPLARILSMIPRNCMTLEDEEDLLFAPSEINTDHLQRAVVFLVAAYDQT